MHTREHIVHNIGSLPRNPSYICRLLFAGFNVILFRHKTAGCVCNFLCRVMEEKGLDGCTKVWMGSGYGDEILRGILCGNWGNGCKKKGCKRCSSCQLIAYCSKECQKQHWPIHKPKCRSHLSSSSTPAWRSSAHLPSWLLGPSDPALTTSPLDFSVYLWGNMPAYAILGLPPLVTPHSLPHIINICFAASGDLRNVVETVCQIPHSFSGRINIYINDHNPPVALRNLLMLELLRAHGPDAIDAVIAFWYSLAMTEMQHKAVTDAVRHVLQSSGDGPPYCAEFMGSSGKSLLEMDVGETASFYLLQLLNDVALSEAKESRRKVLEARPDLIDRKLGCLRPQHKTSWKEFRESGMLLPFGMDHGRHDHANISLFHPQTLEWLQSDGCDPLDGWDVKQVVATGTKFGVPPMDLYGCLFFHLRQRLETFMNKLLGASFQVCLKLSCCDASDLAQDFKEKKIRFHRIDISNLADESYLGIKRSLRDWAPMLSCASEDDGFESVLITLFMNWTRTNPKYDMSSEDSTTAMAKLKKASKQTEELKELARQMIMNGDMSITYYFHDFSNAFNRYLEDKSAFKVGKNVGVEAVKAGLVVPPRLFVPLHSRATTTPGECGDADDCYYHSALSNHTFTERFMEWKRIQVIH